MTDAEAAYADWYVWAKRNLATDSAVCHAAAAAATDVELHGGTREQAIAAARQSTTTGAHLAAPGPLGLERRTYAEWFDWARRELGGVREQQHAAARAAVSALAAGMGANAAVAVARQAAGMNVPPVPPAAPAAPAAPYAPPAPPGYPGYPAQPAPSYPYGPAAPGAFTGYAGFWRRLAAWLLDQVILSAATSAVAVAIGFAYGIGIAMQGGPAPSDTQIQSQLGLGFQTVFEVFTFVVSWLYFTLLESSAWQATIGKRVLGLRVTDEGGARISWARANGRFFAKFLSGLACGLGYLWVAFSPRKQGWHDMLARTLVFRRG